MLIVITGASQGIGAAVAEAFAGPGVRLALLARNRRNLEAVAARAGAAGAEAALFPCDVTDEQAVAATASAVSARWGAAEVLVNNAGVFRPGGLLETSAASFREQVETNLTSAFLVSRAFLPGMIDAGRGHLFFMGSVASIRAYPSGGAYCAAKHGLLGLARSFREETKPHGIRVTTLLAGATFTPSWEGAGLPEERFIPAGDVARAVVEIHRMSPRTVVEEILLRPQLGDV